MSEAVKLSVEGGVATIAINRPQVMNAIAAVDTRFTLAYANIGASPDGGSTYFLPRLVGYKKTMEVRSALPVPWRRPPGAMT